MPETPTLRRDGTPWRPLYVEAIDPDVCIGCGRCFKVCVHGVLMLIGLDEDDTVVAADDDEAERRVMTLAEKGRCIGCAACRQVCGSKALTLAA